MAKKMASLDSALALLNDLHKKSYDVAVEEQKTLEEFAKTKCGFEEEI